MNDLDYYTLTTGNTARDIQQSILCSTLPALNGYQDQFFVIYSPHDEIGGDFYWFGKTGSKIFIALGDATGHGTSAALISTIGHQALSTGLYELLADDPLQLIHYVDQKVTKVLNGNDFTGDRKEGMDIGIVSIDLETGHLEYSGAYLDLLIKRKEYGLTELRASRNSLGNRDPLIPKPFRKYSVSLNEGDSIVLYSDGIVDQFGSNGAGKLKKRRVYDLVRNNDDSILNLGVNLGAFVQQWKGDQQQTDDISCLGFQYKKNR